MLRTVSYILLCTFLFGAVTIQAHDDHVELPELTRTPVSGTDIWINILCRFSDLPNDTPYSASNMDIIMTHEMGVPAYWNVVSNGKLNIVYGGTYGWYNLPYPKSYYVDASGLKTDLIAVDCATAADVDVLFPSVQGINFRVNSDIGFAAGYGGSTTLENDGQRKTYRATWTGYSENTSSVEVESSIVHGLLVHEMGHAYGLGHTVYDDVPQNRSAWDVMGFVGGKDRDVHPDPYTYDNIHPAVGTLAQSTIAYNLHSLGWIGPSRSVTVPNNAIRTIQIERLHQPQTGTDPLIIQVPIDNSSTVFYTIEARMKVGYDQYLPDEGVVIHKIDLTDPNVYEYARTIRNYTADSAVVLSGPPVGPPPTPRPTVAPIVLRYYSWDVGETFVDSTNQITISVISKTETGYEVYVNNGVENPVHVQSPTGMVTGSGGHPVYSWAHTSTVGGYEIYVAPANNLSFVRYFDTLASAEICDATTCSVDLTTYSGTAWLWNDTFSLFINPSPGNLTGWQGPFNFTISEPQPAAVTPLDTDLSNLARPVIQFKLDDTAANASFFQVYVAPMSELTMPIINTWYTREQICGGWAGSTCSVIPDTDTILGQEYVAYVRSWGPGGFSIGGLGGVADGWIEIKFTP